MTQLKFDIHSTDQPIFALSPLQVSKRCALQNRFYNSLNDQNQRCKYAGFTQEVTNSHCNIYYLCITLCRQHPGK